MDDLLEIVRTPPAKPTDPDFFSPQGDFVHVVLRRESPGFVAQAKRGPHQGPVILRSECLRGLGARLQKLGWKKDQISLVDAIPLDELPDLEGTDVPACYQEAPALAIRDFEERFCRAYRYQAPEDLDPIHAAFQKIPKSDCHERAKKYGDLDTHVGHMRSDKMLAEFTTTELCQIEYSSVFCKHEDFKLAVESEIAPLSFDRIRLSAWHNRVTRLTWSETEQIYRSLRTFSMGLPDFTVAFDHTTGSNSKGYSAYFTRNDDAEHHRVYLDGELAYFISYKGKPVLVLSFNVFKPTRKAAPAIYIRQVQMLNTTGNRWLYKLPCHYMEQLLIRMREAFPYNQIYLIRGDALATEIAKNYKATLKRTEERLKQNNYFSENGRANDQEEVRVFRKKIWKMHHEVIGRLRRNYARRSSTFHQYLRRRKGDYWKLNFRKPGEFISAKDRLRNNEVIGQVQVILDAENPCQVRVDRRGVATCREGGSPCCEGCQFLSDRGCTVRADGCKFYFCPAAWASLSTEARARLDQLGKQYVGSLFFRGSKRLIHGVRPPFRW
jgi:hypothetical protein